MAAVVASAPAPLLLGVGADGRPDAAARLEQREANLKARQAPRAEAEAERRKQDALFRQNEQRQCCERMAEYVATRRTDAARGAALARRQQARLQERQLRRALDCAGAGTAGAGAAAVAAPAAAAAAPAAHGCPVISVTLPGAKPSDAAAQAAQPAGAPVVSVTIPSGATADASPAIPAISVVVPGATGSGTAAAQPGAADPYEETEGEDSPRGRFRGRAAEVFQRFDADGMGYISRERLEKKLIQSDEEVWDDPHKLRMLMKAIDADGDGRISFHELARWLKQSGDGWDQVREEDPVFQGSGMRLAHDLVIVTRGSLHDNYTLSSDVVGEGSFGTVTRGVQKNTGNERAIKAIPKQRMERASIDKEISLMTRMDHPNIIKLFEVYEDYRSMYLVMELLTGGELFERIVQERSFTERQAAGVMQQIMQGVRYMHFHSICHRDLKPENFLLLSDAPIEECTVKIIDFGMACWIVAGEEMIDKVGTSLYMAPQVIQGSYDQLCDVWSCGVIMYILLSGYQPFTGDTDREIMDAVSEGEYEMESDTWRDVSQDAKDLIRLLLAYDPEERISSDKALLHIWIKDKAPSAPDEPLQAGHLLSMRNFCGHNKLKKAALNVIARNLREEQIHELKNIFQALDKNGDGKVTFEELNESIHQIDSSALPSNLAELMVSLDVDQSGSIDYTEFLAGTLDRKFAEEESACWAAFQVFDRDGSGTITRSELVHVLQSEEMEAQFGGSNIAQILADCDADNDGQISFEEFVKMMKSTGAA